jgi:hypothetical protein
MRRRLIIGKRIADENVVFKFVFRDLGARDRRAIIPGLNRRNDDILKFSAKICSIDIHH